MFSFEAKLDKAMGAFHKVAKDLDGLIVSINAKLEKKHTERNKIDSEINTLAQTRGKAVNNLGKVKQFLEG